jgi:hypothetical protein
MRDDFDLMVRREKLMKRHVHIEQLLASAERKRVGYKELSVEEVQLKLHFLVHLAG